MSTITLSEAGRTSVRPSGVARAVIVGPDAATGTSRIAASTAAPVTAPRRTAPPQIEPRRPSRRSGRSSGPASRPSTGVPAPRLNRPTLPAASSCEVASRVGPRSSTTRAAARLTDRGIALIIVAGVMVAVAALTVVGATAARVTSGHYQTASMSNR